MGCIFEKETVEADRFEEVIMATLLWGQLELPRLLAGVGESNLLSKTVLDISEHEFLWGR